MHVFDPRTGKKVDRNRRLPRLWKNSTTSEILRPLFPREHVSDRYPGWGSCGARVQSSCKFQVRVLGILFVPPSGGHPQRYVSECVTVRSVRQEDATIQRGARDTARSVRIRVPEPNAHMQLFDGGLALA